MAVPADTGSGPVPAPTAHDVELSPVVESVPCAGAAARERLGRTGGFLEDEP